MYYSETFDEAKAYFRLAVTKMFYHQIPANPINYATWYEYILKTNQELIAEIDHYIETSQEFTDEINAGLFNRFIYNKNWLTSEKAFTAFQHVLDIISQYLEASGGEIAHLGNDFKTYARQLQQASIKPEDLRTIVDQILEKSQKLHQHCANMTKYFNENQNEIKKIRQELETVRKKAMIDPLTGIANRRALEDRLAQEIGKANTFASNLTMLLIDIDYFKQINDTFGHILGDQVLQLVCSIIKKDLKASAFVARYGGDEFIVLLPNTCLKEAAQIGGRIHSEIGSKKWFCKKTKETVGTINVSIGVSLFRQDESKDNFLKRADISLYQAKKKGRNCVVGETDIH